MSDYTKNAQEKTYYVPEGFTPVGGNGGTGEKADIFKLKEANTSFMGVIERRILNKQGKFGLSDLYFFKPVIDYRPQEGICAYGEKSVMYPVDSAMLKERLAGIPDGSLVVIVHKGKPANKNYVAYDVAVDTRYKPLAATTAPAVQTQQFQSQPNYVQPVANPNVNPVYQNQQQPYNGAGNGTNNNQNTFVPSSQIDDDLPF